MGTSEATFQAAQELLSRISMCLFGKVFTIRLERDNKRPVDGRVFLQLVYEDACHQTGELREWHGRKWYLSDHMTPDEVIKTCYAAFKACIEHEAAEAFTVDGAAPFNHHISYEKLIAVSGDTVSRAPIS